MSKYQIVRETLLYYKDGKITTDECIDELINILVPKKRTKAQNDYYWGVVIKIMSEKLGYLAQELHEALLMKVFGTKEVMGYYLPNKRSKELTTQEFEDYLTKVRMLASEMGIFIPLPNEVI